MTSAIKELIKSSGFVVCPSCKGEGEIDYFCGHESTRDCCWCAGNGIVRSLNKQNQRRDCAVCRGRGCLGGCDNRGYHEWESYELL